MLKNRVICLGSTFSILLALSVLVENVSGQDDFGLSEYLKKWFTFSHAKQGTYTMVNGKLVKHDEDKPFSLDDYLPQLVQNSNDPDVPIIEQKSTYNGLESTKPNNFFTYPATLPKGFPKEIEETYKIAMNNPYAIPYPNPSSFNQQPMQPNLPNYRYPTLGNHNLHPRAQNQFPLPTQRSSYYPVPLNARDTAERVGGLEPTYNKDLLYQNEQLGYPTTMDQMSLGQRSPHTVEFSGRLGLPADSNNFGDLKKREDDSSKETKDTFNIDKEFPCPKIGTWEWQGELCIAIGPLPTWACRATDLVVTGRIAICRNKIFYGPPGFLF